MMLLTHPKLSSIHRQTVRGVSFTVSAVVLASLLVACGKKEGGASQVAAKVNKEEISVHQVNFVLQRQPGLKPEQAQVAGKRVLEALIDQELAIQQAHEQKIDRDPRVVMAIEAAKREVIARAYAEKVAEGAAKPTDEEIHQYFLAKPALFSQRRVYNLIEFTVEAEPGQQAGLAGQLQGAKTPEEATAILRASGLRYNSRRVVQPAENLPLPLLDQIANLSDGQQIRQQAPNGLSVIFMMGSKPAPATEQQAKPAIAAFLLNNSKRKLLEDNVKGLRSAAKIEYLGSFAAGAATTPAAQGAASEAPPAGVADPASGVLDDNALKKGLSGLK